MSYKTEVESAAGGSLQCAVVKTFGTDISEMGNVCNISTCVPKSVWGRETYIPVLEPLTAFTNDGRKWGKDFETVRDLVEDFTKFVEQYDSPEYAGQNYIRIEYCGYDYMWRPKHKTHYGNYTMYYLALPIIARYALYCYPTLEIDHNSSAALPYKYKGVGTAKGLFNPDMCFDNPYGTYSDIIEDATETTESNEDRLYSLGLFTRVKTTSGFNRVFATAKIGSEIFNAIDAALEELKENGVKITQGTTFDKIQTARSSGLGLFYYGQLPKDIGNLIAVTPMHNSKVSIIMYPSTVEYEVEGEFSKVFPDLEVI